MALLFADSFDHYGTSDIGKKWPQSGFGDSGLTIRATSGRRGGGAVYLPGNGGYLKKSFSGNYSTLIVGAAFSAATVAQARALFEFWEGSTRQITICYAPGGVIKVQRGASVGGTVLGTSVASMAANAFNYLEAKVTFHGTTGSVEVRLNGVSILTVTGANTSASGNAYANSVCLGETGSGATYQTLADDFYICDATGTVNNDFLGDVRVDCLLPTADGSYNTFNSSIIGRAARYWRAYVTGTQGGSYVAANELEFRSSLGGADQCSGGSASASSATAASAFDNNSGTAWSPNLAVPHWIAYDFGVGVTKEIVEISWTIGSTAAYAPTAFELQYSDDGNNWYRAFECTSPATWAVNETRVFTRPANAKYWQVDDTGGIATDNVYSNTSGNRQTFGFQDLASTTGTVYGVQPVAALAKDDAGTRAAKLLTKSGGTLASGATNYLGTSVSMVSQILETDPATSAAWTPNAINNAEFGVEVV